MEKQHREREPRYLPRLVLVLGMLAAGCASEGEQAEVQSLIPSEAPMSSPANQTENTTERVCDDIYRSTQTGGTNRLIIRPVVDATNRPLDIVDMSAEGVEFGGPVDIANVPVTWYDLDGKRDSDQQPECYDTPVTTARVKVSAGHLVTVVTLDASIDGTELRLDAPTILQRNIVAHDMGEVSDIAAGSILEKLS